MNVVFVPFIGDFFQSFLSSSFGTIELVFVPFIGDFFQSRENSIKVEIYGCFRPLYRGLFSIQNSD